MSEIEILHGRVQIDSNAEEAGSAFDQFTSRLNKNLGAIGKFETEVTDFASATALAFEAPQRPAAEFFSAIKVGFSTLKSGSVGAATGVATITNALGNLVRRVPAFANAAEVFDKVSAASSVMGKIFKRVRRISSGLSGDVQVLARQASDYAENLYAQTRALKIAHQVEVESLRDIVNWRKRALNSSKDRILAIEAEIVALDKQNQRNQAQIPVLEKDLALRNRAVEALVRESEALTNRRDAAAGTAEYAVLNERLFKLDIRREKALNDVNRRYEKYQSILGQVSSHTEKEIALRQEGVTVTARLAKEEKELAKARDEYNRVSMEKATKAGMDVSVLRNNLSNLSKVLVTAEEKAREQGNTTEIAGKKTRKYGEEVAKAAQSGKAFAKTSQQVNQSLFAVSRSFSSVSPGISRVIYTVQNFNNVFTNAMRNAGTVAEIAAAKIKASMLITKGVFIAAGAAAILFIKKTGLIAAEVTTLEITMRQVARNLALKAGADVQKFVDYVDKIPESLKGITTREALVATTSFLRGVPQLLGRVKDLADAAKNFGVTVADLSSSEVFGQFNKFIQSGNTMLLKRLNIVTTADQMHKKYAATIGKSSKDLTAAEKITARFNGIMEEVALTEGVYEKAMQSAGKALSSLSRVTEQAGLVMGKRFEPMIAKIIFGVKDLLEWFTELSPGMHDFIANMIQMTAAAGGLVAVITVAGPAIRILIPIIKTLGLSIKTAFPWMIAIGAAIGAIVLAVKVFKKVWASSALGPSLKDLADTVKTTFLPVIKDVQFWLRSISKMFEEIVTIVSQLLIPLFDMLSGAIMQSGLVWNQVFSVISDVVNGSMRSVMLILWAVVHLLRGELPEALASLETAWLDALTTIAVLAKNTVGKAANWGWNLVVNFANGIMSAASKVLAQAMTFFGNLIGRFIEPGSPPEEGPLRRIIDWGKGLMETLLRSFGLADFSLLRDAMAPIRTALQDAVASGNLAEDLLAPTIQGVREDVATLISEFRKTGVASEEIMNRISATLGEGGADITKYVGLLLEHEKAMRNLADVQEEVAEAQAQGFVPEDLRMQLEAAEDQVSAAEEAVNWQKEFIAAQKETLDLELQHLKALEKLADAAERLAAAAGGGAGEGGAGEEPQFELDFPDIEDVGDVFGDLRETLGQTSAEWDAMRLKIEGAWQAVKDWIALPLDEKLKSFNRWLAETGQKILTWFSNVTGIDSQAIIDLFDSIGKLDLSGVIEALEKITGWEISTWIDDIKKTIGEAWDWIVEKSQWLYDELVGASIIPDLVKKINEEFQKLSFVKWVNKKIEGFKKLWRKLAAFMAPIVNLILAPIRLVVTVIGRIIEGAIKSWPNLTDSFGGLGDAFAELGVALGELWIAVKPIVALLGGILYFAITLFSASLSGVITVIGEVVEAIVRALPGAIQIFTGVIKFVTGVVKIISGLFFLLTGNSEKAGEMFRGVFESFLSGVSDIAVGILRIMGEIAAGIILAVTGFILTVVEKIVTWVTGILEQFGLLEEGTTEKVKAWFTAVGENFDNFKLLLQTLVDDAVAIAQGLWDQILVIWGALFGEEGIVTLWVKQAVDDVIAFFVKLFTDLVGQSILTDLQDGIEKIWKYLFDKDEGIISTWVSNAIDAVIGFFTGLYGSLIGNEDSIFNQIKNGIVTAWTDLFDPEKGFIVTKIQGMVDAVVAFGQSMYTAGREIISKFFAGIVSKWDEGKEALGDLWGWVVDQLPGSEPKDPKSPFRGLEKRGAAIWENLLAGMDTVNVEHAFGQQLSAAMAGMQGSQVNNANNVQIQQGAFQVNFPNVRTGNDANGVMGSLENQIEGAGGLANFRFGNKG